jgi:hypothetical protein
MVLLEFMIVNFNVWMLQQQIHGLAMVFVMMVVLECI